MTEKAAFILKLWREGKSAYEIGKMVGYKGSAGYVYWVIKKYGKQEQKSACISKATDKELFICDMHLPHADGVSVNCALDYARECGVNKIVLGGDIVDFMSVSFWLRDPNERDLQSEREIAIEFLSDLRNSFPNAEIYYLKGNHEKRLETFIQSKAPEFWNMDELSISALLKLEANNIKYVDNEEQMRRYGKPFAIGKLYHMHGHEIRSTFTPINVARNLFLKAMANIIFGHFHVTQEWIQRKLAGEVAGSWAVGCLADLVAPYAPVNNWNHGFATVDYRKSGEFITRNLKIINGDVL